MAKTSEWQSNRWVEERLAVLSPPAAWQPNAARGLARLHEKRSATRVRGQKWVWAGVVAMVAGFCLLAFPAPRVLAYRCLDCSVALWQSFSASAPVSADVKPEKNRKVAPDFTLDDAAGNPVKLSVFKGKVVLLNFWATWCHGCQIEIPWFMEFQSKYKDGGLTAIGVSMDADGWKSVKPYLQEKKLNYSTVIGNEDLAKLYGVAGLPVTLLIDRDGKIAVSHTGLVSKDDYQAEVEMLLAEKKAAPAAAP